ncbi:hypothetical protein C8R43DRAFT_1126488 [Mycena crocata]|nr:hypothetical protein C8R43DRAFT_1126488 [Mycena crocata]
MPRFKLKLVNLDSTEARDRDAVNCSQVHLSLPARRLAPPAPISIWYSGLNFLVRISFVHDHLLSLQLLALLVLIHPTLPYAPFEHVRTHARTHRSSALRTPRPRLVRLISLVSDPHPHLCVRPSAQCFKVDRS